MIKKMVLKGMSAFGVEKTLTRLSVRWLKKVHDKQFSEKIFMEEGLLPILDHYYHPMINPKKDLIRSLRENRNLPGIKLNEQEQLDLLSQFHYNEELLAFPLEKKSDSTIEYFYANGNYESGDSEYLYNMIRHFKPQRIIEIGSGYSTLMARSAINKNQSEDDQYTCRHICIEPYEQPWLEKTGAEIIREKVETIDLQFFSQLSNHDILFIDSSHIIRPQGDVLFEYQVLLPILNPGVLVHIHDIFTPKDYPDEWVYTHRFWNEQYLLEAFLVNNAEFKIIGALNYLKHSYYKELSEKCPVFAKQSGREPGAFWLAKV